MDAFCIIYLPSQFQQNSLNYLKILRFVESEGVEREGEREREGSESTVSSGALFINSTFSYLSFAIKNVEVHFLGSLDPKRKKTKNNRVTNLIQTSNDDIAGTGSFFLVSYPHYFLIVTCLH